VSPVALFAAAECVHLESADRSSTRRRTASANDGASARRTGHAPRLLVADDDGTTRGLLVGILSHAGFQADGAADGREALARLGSEHYDVVISDVHMPGMSGLALLDALHARGVSVPVVLVTGSPDEVAQTARMLGAFAVMGKPFDLDELIRVIGSALGSGGRGPMRAA
jgi:CheY-like chemotaxis protein